MLREFTPKCCNQAFALIDPADACPTISPIRPQICGDDAQLVPKQTYRDYVRTSDI